MVIDMDLAGILTTLGTALGLFVTVLAVNASTRRELKADIEATRRELKADIARVESTLTGHLKHLDDRVYALATRMAPPLEPSSPEK